jgi:hypothetical protein
LSLITRAFGSPKLPHPTQFHEDPEKFAAHCSPPITILARRLRPRSGSPPSEQRQKVLGALGAHFIWVRSPRHIENVTSLGVFRLTLAKGRFWGPWVEAIRAIFESKFMLPWSFSEEAAASKVHGAGPFSR